MKAVASPNSAPGHGAPFLVRLPPDQKEGVHRGVCVCVCVCVCVWSHLEERGLGVMGAKGKPRPGRAAGPGLPGAGGGAGWAGHPALHWGPVWRLGEGDGWVQPVHMDWQGEDEHACPCNVPVSLKQEPCLHWRRVRKAAKIIRVLTQGSRPRLF